MSVLPVTVWVSSRMRNGSQVPATAHVLPIRNVMAPDQARASKPREELLENAPAREEGYFRVRAVLEEEE